MWKITCGIRTDQTLTCWGDRSYYDPSTEQLAQWEAPSGKFTAVTTSGNHLCGIRTDQTLTCWGDLSFYDPSTEQLAQWEAPSGKFTAVTISERHGCGIRTDQTLACWGLFEGFPGPAWMDRFGPPTDRFGPG